MEESVWKIFIPSEILNHSSGYLYGTIINEEKTLILTELSAEKKHLEDRKHLGEFHSTRNIKSFAKTTSSQPGCSKDLHINLFMTDFGRPSVDMHISRRHVQCTPIIIDSVKLSESLILQSMLDVQTFFPLCIHCDSNTDKTLDVDLELSSVIKFFETHLVCVKKHDRLWYHLEERNGPDSGARFKPLAAIHIIYMYLSTIFFNRFTELKIFSFLLSFPTTITHIKNKSEVIKRTKKSKNASSHILQHTNLDFGQAVDTLLGLLVMLFITQTTVTEDFAHVALKYGERAVTELTDLLDWLMGAPAGLKLNKDLTEFMGHFYLYHVYLWSGYLSLLKPVLAPLLWYSSLVGILGLSFQLALLQDIFSTLVIHLYCFYVYAARLYSIQVYALRSLLRLFRGKKWNVLRKRVDSASYDVDQLFLGTLLFTILLFLLPTTGLYYVVFTLMRLAILIMQGVVSKIMDILTDFELYTLSLWCFNSNKVAGEFGIIAEKPFGNHKEDKITLNVNVRQKSLSDIMKICKRNSGEPAYSCREIIQRLFLGQLIFPWTNSGHDF